MDSNFDKIDKNTIDAAQRGDTKAILQNLNDKDRQKIEAVLADKEKLNKILSSDTAQRLMKILGGKQNG